MSLLKWGWIPLVGLSLIAWGYFGAPAPEPTAIFSTSALFILGGGGLVFAGIILLAVLYTGEQNKLRARALDGTDIWHPNGGYRRGAARRP